MTTTAVFAEIIVVGLEAEAWIALVVLTIWGTEWVAVDEVASWSALVTVLILATAYVFGIIVDRIADAAVTAAAKRLGDPQTPERVKFREQRLTVLKESDGIAKFLDYQRSRQRVARGTIVNALCATVAVPAFLLIRTDASAWWALGAAGLGLILVLGAVYANERIFKAYNKNLRVAYRLVSRRD